MRGGAALPLRALATIQRATKVDWPRSNASLKKPKAALY
jgi:hypothetical protein